MEERRKIVVVVEDEEASRTALLWSLHNIVRHADVITLLHVYTSSSNNNTTINNININNKKKKKKMKKRFYRLKAFQLALSFKDTCSNFPNAKIEIVVTEGEDEGDTIVRFVREIGANTLVVGLHDHSFLYRLGMAHNNMGNIFNCKVLAINEPTTSVSASKRRTNPTNRELPSSLQSSTNMDFSHIQISSGLRVPDITSPKIPYRICPNPSAIIWRSRKTRRKSESNYP